MIKFQVQIRAGFVKVFVKDSFPFKSFDHVTLFIKPEAAVYTHVTRYKMKSSHKTTTADLMKRVIWSKYHPMKYAIC